MKQWIEAEWDYTFFDIKMRVQDSMQRFLCISEKLINIKKSGEDKNIELRNIYFDKFEDSAVELSRLWNEIISLWEARKQELFIMVNFYIKNLPCKLKRYALDRLALNVLSEMFTCSELVRKVLFFNSTKGD